MLHVKTLYHMESKDLATQGFQNKIHTEPLKHAKAKPSFRKVSLPLAKVRMLFPAHLWFREFGHKSTPSDRHWTEA